MFTEGLSFAISEILTGAVLLAFLLGTLNGIFFGMIPGLSGSLGIALMIPFTYGMDGSSAIVLFCAAMSGQTFAGSISAILINTPGTSPNAVTCFDGYPLAKQGRGAFAIGISAASSALGTLFASLVIVAALPFVRAIILRFSFPEFTMLAVLGIAAIALASSGSRILGLVSGAFGLLLSFVGFAPVGGELRYVFGQTWLVTGIAVLPVLIGLFAMSESFVMLTKGDEAGSRKAKVETAAARLEWKRQPVEGILYTLRHLPLVMRSSILGTALGIVPAVGGTVASFMAYFAAKRSLKDNTFGEGDPRGVIAPESANDAKDAGSALPSLAFGIPGSAEWAIILGAMVIHGVQPGPRLIIDFPHIIWLAVIAIAMASFVTSGLGIVLASQVAKVTLIDPRILAPMILMLGTTGAFALRGDLVDVGIAVVFGIIALAMRWAKMPVVPLILGLLLGSRTERAFQQSVLTFDSMTIFLRRPISLILVLATIWIVVTAVREAVGDSRRTQAGADGTEPRMNPTELRFAIVLCAILGALALYAVSVAQTFNETSRGAPTYVGVLLIALCGLAIYSAVRQLGHARMADGEGDGGSPTPPESGTVRAESGEGNAMRRALTAQKELTGSAGQPERVALSPVPAVGLLIGAVLLATLIGLNLSLLLLAVVLLRRIAHVSWVRSVTLAVGFMVALTLIFNVMLRIPLRGGSLLDYIVYF